MTGTGETLVDGCSPHARVQAGGPRVAPGRRITLAREAIAARLPSLHLFVVV